MALYWVTPCTQYYNTENRVSKIEYHTYLVFIFRYSCKIVNGKFSLFRLHLGYTPRQRMTRMRPIKPNNTPWGIKNTPKPFNRQTVISINQLFKVLSSGRNTCPQPWPPLINGLVDNALLELSPDRNKPLLQIVDVLYGWLVNAFLHQTPRSYSRPGWGLASSQARVQVQWSLGSHGAEIRSCHVPCVLL